MPGRSLRLPTRYQVYMRDVGDVVIGPDDDLRARSAACARRSRSAPGHRGRSLAGARAPAADHEQQPGRERRTRSFMRSASPFCDAIQRSTLASSTSSGSAPSPSTAVWNLRTSKRRPSVLLGAGAQFADLELADLVGERLAGDRDVALGLGDARAPRWWRCSRRCTRAPARGSSPSSAGPCPPRGGSRGTARPRAGRSTGTGPRTCRGPGRATRRRGPSPRCRPCSRRSGGTAAGPSARAAMEIWKWWPGLPSCSDSASIAHFGRAFRS